LDRTICSYTPACAKIGSFVEYLNRNIPHETVHSEEAKKFEEQVEGERLDYEQRGDGAILAGTICL
jgi:hypothetical protein